MSARPTNGRSAWPSLLLAVLAGASVLVALRVLALGPERAARSAAHPVTTESPATAPALLAAPPPAEERPQRLQAGGELDPRLALRVEDATAQLAQALLEPEYEDARWRTEVQARAGTLGRAARPALRAILADDARSVEEHVAAGELLEALEPR